MPRKPLGDRPPVTAICAPERRRRRIFVGRTIDSDNDGMVAEIADILVRAG
jgi:hypothetical protein